MHNRGCMYYKKKIMSWLKEKKMYVLLLVIKKIALFANCC